MVLEELLLKNKKIPPLIIVGTEGLWGLVFMIGLILPIMAVVPGSDVGVYENSKVHQVCGFYK
jgi:hypothetical protein